MQTVWDLLEQLKREPSLDHKVSIIKTARGHVMKDLRWYLRSALDMNDAMYIPPIALANKMVGPLPMDMVRVKKTFRPYISGKSSTESFSEALRELLKTNGIGRSWVLDLASGISSAGVSEQVYKEAWKESILQMSFSYPVRKYRHKHLFDDAWYIEPALSGIRAVAIYLNGQWMIIGEDGTPLHNTAQITKQLHLQKIPEDMTIDCILTTSTLESPETIARTLDPCPSYKDLLLIGVDMIPSNEWKNKSYKTPIETRKHNLRFYMGMKLTRKRYHIYPTSQDNLLVCSGKQALTAQSISRGIKNLRKSGYGSVILKKAGSIYPFEKSHLWIQIDRKQK